LCAQDAIDSDPDATRPGCEECRGCGASGESSERAFRRQARLRDRLRAISCAFVIASVPGDVALTIARELARRGDRVGLLYLDGRPTPIAGLTSNPLLATDHGVLPVEADDGLVVMWPGLLGQGAGPSPERPCRDLREAVTRFIADVEWGPLDHLVVRMPTARAEEVGAIAATLGETRVLLVAPSRGGVLDVRSASGEPVGEDLLSLVGGLATQGTPLATRNHGPGTESET